MIVGLIFMTTGAAALMALLANLPRCYRGILNDARIISKDPALQTWSEILYAYPGFWALFWYRLSHALLERRIPLVSAILPRLAMSLVRYATAIDIHPEANISAEGVLIDHGTGLVIGATAIVGGGVTLYHGVTLGGTGKPAPPGSKRHPTVGSNVVIGSGAKILGDIEIGDNVLVGANSVVTKSVPANHTAVGIPARVLCRGSGLAKDVTGAAICELHRRLQRVEREKTERQTEEATGAAAAVVVENVDAAPPTIRKAEQEFQLAGRVQRTPDRSRASTASPSPDASPDRNAGAAVRPSGQNSPDVVVVTPTAVLVGEFVKAGGRSVVPGEGQRGDEPNRDVSSFMSPLTPSSSLSAVEEVVYGMQALGQKAFGAIRVNA